MTIKCRLCGNGIEEIGGYLHRVNEKGVPCIWECRPTCKADLPQDTNLLLALECGPEEMTPNAKSDGADAVLSRTLPLD